MKTVILDLTGCKSLWDIHERIREAFGFPDWYGKNWDAFYDLLSRDCDAEHVIVRGEHTLPSEYSDQIKTMHSVFENTIKFCKKLNFSSFSYEIES